LLTSFRCRLREGKHARMITFYLRYEVDDKKLADFEAYGAMCAAFWRLHTEKRTSDCCSPRGKLFRACQPTKRSPPDPDGKKKEDAPCANE